MASLLNTSLMTAELQGREDDANINRAAIRHLHLRYAAQGRCKAAGVEASQALAALQQRDGLPPPALGMLVHLAAELTQLPLILKVLRIDEAVASWICGGVVTWSAMSQRGTPCQRGRAQMSQKVNEGMHLHGACKAVFTYFAFADFYSRGEDQSGIEC